MNEKSDNTSLFNNSDSPEFNESAEDNKKIIKRLEQFNSTGYSRVQNTLRAKLLAELGSTRSDGRQGNTNKKTKKNRMSQLRWILVPSGIILFLAAVNIIFPPMRIYAQEFFSRLLGNTLITNETPQIEPTFDATIAETPYVSLTPIPWQSLRRLTLEEAEQEAGFTISTPSQIPAGYRLAYFDVLQPDELNPYVAVMIIYEGGLQNNDTIRTMTIRQLYNQEGKINRLAIGDADFQEIKVRNQDGVWLEGVSPATTIQEDDSMNDRKLNMLGWVENGFEFWISSNDNLPLDQLLMVAESIQKGQAAVERNVDSLGVETCPTTYGMNIEAAEEASGFDLFSPDYLPETYCFNTVEVYAADQNVEELTVAIFYRSVEAKSEDNPLVITQKIQGEEPFNLPAEFKSTSISLRNTQVVYFEQPLEPYLKILMWEENGYEIVLSGNNDLSQTELTLIADSMHQ